MNVDALRKIQAYIREHPDELEMEIVYGQHKQCGCIAGTWMRLTGVVPKYKWKNDYHTMVPVLDDLSDPEDFDDWVDWQDWFASELGMRAEDIAALVFTDEWRPAHKDYYRATKKSSVRADIACAVIDEFIALHHNE